METRFVAQKSWGWRVAIYLFLAGVGSGSTLVGLAYGFIFRYLPTVVKVGLAMGPPLVIFGCLFLVFDLGRPFVSYLTPEHARHSWISRGILILSAFIMTGLIHSALWIWPWQVIADFSWTWIILGTINIVLSLLVSIYTGLLLGYTSIPFWNTPILPILFLASSVSTGISAIVLITVHVLGGMASAKEVSWLLNIDVAVILGEMVVVTLYFYGMKLITVARVSVMKIIFGALAPLFWIGFVLIGLVIPMMSAFFSGGTFFSSLCGLTGGYLLRYVVLRGGIKSPLSAQGIIIPVSAEN